MAKAGDKMRTDKNSSENIKTNDTKFNLSALGYIFSTEVASLVAVNICFLIFSIPIFTIGASLLTMQEIMCRLYLNEKVNVFKEFFDIFKKNFIQGLKVFAVFLIIFGTLAISAYYYLSLSPESNLYPLGILSLIAIVVAVGICDIFIQGLSYTKLSIPAMLKNSFILYFAYPLKAILSAIITIAMLILCVFLFPTTIPLTFLLTISLALLAKTCNTFSLIQIYVTKTI